MTRSQTVGIRLYPEDKTLLDDICEEHGVKPGTFAGAAVSAWLEACRAAGGYVKPEFSKGEVQHA